jgi:hypothetical protein
MRVTISRSTKNMQGKWQNEVGRQLWYLLPSKDMSLGNPNYYRAIGSRPSYCEGTASGRLNISLIGNQRLTGSTFILSGRQHGLPSVWQC